MLIRKVTVSSGLCTQTIDPRQHQLVPHHTTKPASAQAHFVRTAGYTNTRTRPGSESMAELAESAGVVLECCLEGVEVFQNRVYATSFVFKHSLQHQYQQSLGFI